MIRTPGDQMHHSRRALPMRGYAWRRLRMVACLGGSCTGGRGDRRPTGRVEAVGQCDPCTDTAEATALALLGRNRGVSGGGGLEQAGGSTLLPMGGYYTYGGSPSVRPRGGESAVGDFLAPDYFECDIHASRIIKIAPGHWVRGSDPRPASPIQTPVLRPRHAKRP